MQWLRNLPVSADVVASPGFVHSCACVILFRPSLSLNNSWCDNAGRYLQCEFSFLVKVFRVVCLYAPNRNPARDDFFDSLHTKIVPSIPTILAGDFNAVLTGRLTVAVLTPPVHPVRAPRRSVTYSNRAA